MTGSSIVEWIAVPGGDDDKYSRGVLGLRIGSGRYPGAAVLGVEAAWRTGVGMVRYHGPEQASQLVLARRPETVTAAGRVQAWVLGSGMDPTERDAGLAAELEAAFESGVPVIADAGVLDLVVDGIARREGVGPVLITPHAGELGRMLGVLPGAVRAQPERAAAAAAERFGATVLLKGSTTRIAAPDGRRREIGPSSPWLAVAGSGDVLAGILGALAATQHERLAGDPDALFELAAAAVALHALAAGSAAGPAPFTALDLARRLPAIIAALLAAG